MDIAKIRKKFKEGEKGKAAAEPEVIVEDAPSSDTQSPSVTEKPCDAVRKETQTSVPGKTARSAEPEVEKIELLTFQLSSEEFAFQLSDIEEILRFQRITNVPRVPEYILGITSLRGKIIPVVDLKMRFSISDSSDKTEDGSRKKILILKGSKGLFGALVDRVRGVIRIAPSDISEPPAHLTEGQMIFIDGVILHKEKFVSVVRMEELLDMKG